VQNSQGTAYLPKYDGAGRVTMITGGLYTRKYQYDAADRRTTLIEVVVGSTPIVTIVDTYDNVGNRTVQNKDGTITSWTYDAEYRLVSQILSGARATFSYDNAGNLTVKWQEGTNPMSFTCDAANRLVTILQGSTLSTYTYDNNGNLTAENVGGTRTTYGYDSRHEAARWIVLRGRSRQDRVSHHPYPTRKIESPRTTYPVSA
jgi:YD repeat-containing protein